MAVNGQKMVNFPLIGETAPTFEAVTTKGTINLGDFKGKWLVFFSHPADFTPVCTTEFIAFEKIQPELKKREVELLGLSVDSVHSHIAWLRNIEEKTGVKITFPVIADIDRYISMLYGMIHPSQSQIAAVRCLFIIDPRQVIRAILYYPLTTGRNMDEILRVIDALQTTDQYLVSTPANWKPGEKVIVPSPSTLEEVEEIAKKDYECVDWYLCKRDLKM